MALRRLRLAFFVLCFALCARTASAQSYINGAVDSTGLTFCNVGIGQNVFVLTAYAGYFGSASFPKTGDTGYVHAVASNVSPSACQFNDTVRLEFFLPTGASLAISATNKVFCFYTPSGGATVPLPATIGTCPQTAVPDRY